MISTSELLEKGFWPRSKDGVMYAIKPSRLGRDPGYESENRDCFVQAIQCVTGVPYRDAHAFTALHFARKTGKGTCFVDLHMKAIAEKQETIFGYRVFVKPIPTRRTVRRSRRTFDYVQATVYPTVADSLYLMRSGRYLVCSGSHAWAVIDGVIYDNGVTGNRTRVTEVYEFKASSQCE